MAARIDGRLQWAQWSFFPEIHTRNVWKLCDEYSFKAEFMTLSLLAARELNPEDVNVETWLDALKHAKPDALIMQEGPAVTHLSDGMEIEGVGGMLSNLCSASADFCNSLAIFAIVGKPSHTAHGKAKPDDKPTHETAAPDALDRERRLKRFVSDNAISIAAVCRAAGVFKANMHQWRHGTMGDTSVMAARIENVLNGKIPIDIRGKKRG
jgi:hypothetical protein